MGRLLAGIGIAVVASLAWTWLAGSERSGRPLPVLAASTTSEVPETAREPATDRKPAPAIPQDEPEDLESYAIDVSVMRYFRGEKTPLPGIEVAFGAGRKGAAPRWIDGPVLARGVSDEQGRVGFHAELPWEKVRAGDVFWVRVESPGHQRMATYRAVSRAKQAEPVVLWAREGGTLFGEVRNDSGEPVPSAEVALFKEGSDGSGGFSKCDAAGRFALDYRTVGRRGVHARARGQGSGAVRGIELSRDAPHEDVTVVVRGSGLLTGRILDLSGNPVRGLRMWADPAGADPELSRGQILWAERDGGIWGDVTTTGPDGSFRFEALAHGSYVLMDSGPPRRTMLPYPLVLPPSIEQQARDRNRQALSSSAYPTGTDDLELRVELHRIEVSIFDAEGRPVDPAAAVKRGAENGSTYILSSRDPPALTCLPIAPEPGPYSARPAGVSSGSVASFRVVADRQYVLTWAEPGYPLQEKRVTVSWETFLTSVRFDLPEPTGKTYLKLHVSTPDGRPFVLNKQVRVWSKQSGKLIASTLGTGWNRERHAEPAFSTALPPGAYRVRVTTKPFQGCKVTFPRPRAPHAPVELEVDVPPGVTTVRDVRLGSSGWLELEPLDPRAKPEPSVIEELMRVEGIEEAVRKRFQGQETSLTSLADGSKLAPEFETRDLRVWFWSSFPWVFRGYAARSLDPIPVGRYRLRIGPEDAPLLERTIEIDEGATTTVAW